MLKNKIFVLSLVFGILIQLSSTPAIYAEQESLMVGVTGRSGGGKTFLVNHAKLLLNFERGKEFGELLDGVPFEVLEKLVKQPLIPNRAQVVELLDQCKQLTIADRRELLVQFDSIEKIVRPGIHNLKVLRSSLHQDQWEQLRLVDPSETPLIPPRREVLLALLKLSQADIDELAKSGASGRRDTISSVADAIAGVFDKESIIPIKDDKRNKLKEQYIEGEFKKLVQFLKHAQGSNLIQMIIDGEGIIVVNASSSSPKLTPSPDKKSKKSPKKNEGKKVKIDIKKVEEFLKDEEFVELVKISTTKGHLSKLMQQRSPLLHTGVVSQDLFYESDNNLEKMAKSTGEGVNYDSPWAFRQDQMIRNLLELKMRKSTLIPKSYDYTDPTEDNSNDKKDKDSKNVKKSLEVSPTKEVGPFDVVLVEGIHVFHDPRMRELLHFKAFVDEDAIICLMRRKERDLLTRGRMAEGVLSMWFGTQGVEQMYKDYIEILKKAANAVYSGIDPNSPWTLVDSIVGEYRRTIEGASDNSPDEKKHNKRKGSSSTKKVAVSSSPDSLN